MSRKHSLGPGITGYSGGMPNRAEVIELVTDAARAAGCTCDLEIEVPENYTQPEQPARVTVRHDDDCPLVA